MIGLRNIPARKAGQWHKAVALDPANGAFKRR
jgi:hypothetical protein